MRKSFQSVQLGLPEESQGGFSAEQSLWLETPAQHWLKPTSYKSRLTGIVPLLTTAWWWALNKASQSDPELVIIRSCNDKKVWVFFFSEKKSANAVYRDSQLKGERDTSCRKWKLVSVLRPRWQDSFPRHVVPKKKFVHVPKKTCCRSNSSDLFDLL